MSVLVGRASRETTARLYAGNEKHRRTPGKVVFDRLRAFPTADGFRYPANYRALAQVKGSTVAGILAAIWGLWLIGWFVTAHQPASAPLSVGATQAIGIGLAVWNLVWSVLVVSWYVAYRRSDDQLHHRLLSRGVVAEAKEIREKLGERVTAGTAAVVRPVFTERANLDRGHAVAATVLAPEVAALKGQAEQQYGRALTAAEIAFLAYGLSRQVKRVAAPAADQGIAAANAVANWQQDNDDNLAAFKAKWGADQAAANLAATPRSAATDCPVAELISSHEFVLECDCPPLVNLRNKKCKGVCASDVGTLFGTAFGENVWVGIERPLMVIGPARSGKGVHLVIPWIIDAPGAVVTTSTRPDNYYATAVCRAARGKIAVFNLDASKYVDEFGVTRPLEVPHTIRWSPLEGCEDPATAMRRAGTWVASSGLGGENAVWATAAQAIVQAFLLAAALKKLTIDDVWYWAQSYANHETPLKILRELDFAEGLCTGWDQALEVLKSEDKRMIGNKWFGVANAFAGLAVPEVRKALSHRPGDHGYFDTKEFLRHSGTVYMMSRGSDGPDDKAGSVGGIYSLFLDHVTEMAQKLGKTSKGGHLDPPLSLLLDELANIHPWKAAPRIMSEGSGVGVQLVAYFQSLAQARNAYLADNAKLMWDNANPVLLGGLKDPDDLADFAKLVQTYEVDQVSTTYDTGFLGRKQVSKQRLQGVELDELSRLPFGVAATLPPRTNLVVARMTPYWRGPHAGCIARSQAWHQENPGRVLQSAVVAREFGVAA